MAPRNPDEGPDEGEPNEAPQIVHEAPRTDGDAPPAPEQRSAAPSEIPQDEKRDGKAGLDRVEIYLRGPTVFTA